MVKPINWGGGGGGKDKKQKMFKKGGGGGDNGTKYIKFSIRWCHQDQL